MPGRVLGLALVGIVVLMVLTALLTGEAAIAGAFGLAGLIVLLGLGANAFIAKRQSDAGDSASDRTDDMPSAHMSPDPGGDESPLGDSSQVHDEVSPHDLPVGHPGRAAAERIAGEGGTTRGHAAGGAADAEQRVGERD